VKLLSLRGRVGGRWHRFEERMVISLSPCQDNFTSKQRKT